MFKRTLTQIRLYLAGQKFAEALKRAARTFGYAFLGLMVPGVLGWLHAFTDWAQDGGQAPFPDATSLLYLALSAIGSGCIAVVNLLGIVVEDAAGKPVLRKPGA